MQHHLNIKKPNLLCLILLISFPSFVAVLISPALPRISDSFNITNGFTQQLVTLFILGYALGQLIYSPFANRFGRKIAIYIGISIYLLSCIICLVAIRAHFFNLLIFGRFLMGLGSATGMIISFAIINDFYQPEQARSVISYTVLAYAFMPAVAVAVGGLITTRLSWIDCFYFFIFYGVLILAISTLLPETLQEKNKNALKIKPILQAYKNAFRRKRLLLFGSIYGCMGAYVYVIASGAPFVAMDTIHLKAAQYGLLFLIPYGGQFMGAILAGRYSKKFSAYQVMYASYSCIILGTLIMLISFSLHWVNSFSLLASIFFIMLGMPPTYGSVTVMAMLGFKDKATGAAVMSFTTMIICLTAVIIYSLLPNHFPIVLAAVLTAFMLLAILLFWLGKRNYAENE